MLKRLSSTLAAVAVAVAALAFLAVTPARADSWSGWISDAGCGVKGAAATHKACAVRCNGRGSKWVFVNSATKEVVAIHNQDAVSADNVGMEVTVTGSLMDDKSLHVESIAAKKSM